MCAVLISLVIAASVFGISAFAGNALLDNTIYSKSFEKKMTAQQADKLQEYIRLETITKENIHRLNVWCNSEKKLYLTIYDDDRLVYESPFSENVDTNSVEDRHADFDIELENPNNLYLLSLADETEVQAFIYYYAGYSFYLFVTIVSGILAFIAFSLCFIMLINKKISYIKMLKQELEILSGGQLEYPITIKGADEIGELASGIDQMRQSIIRHRNIEGQLRSANSELITSMSHDLRTPLTSLLAYLEIIDRKKYSDEKQMHSLINKSIEKTMRIKDMADKLFEYFLVYASEWECSEMETINADQLFHHFLGEYAYSLENHGFKIYIDHSEAFDNIVVNMPLLQRVFDNVYSNILKYADKEHVVLFTCNKVNDNLVLVISNGVLDEGIKRESTNIGLKTCERIMQYHGGSFTTSNYGGKFASTIELPISH